MPNGSYLKLFALAYERAVPEVRSKTLDRIHAETAMSWCARACAWANWQPTNPNRASAVEFAHEAIEHAALCADPAVLQFVRTMLRKDGIIL